LDNFPEEIQRVENLDILGIPITNAAAFAIKRLQKIQSVLENLLEMENLQGAFLLFKHCFGPMKINHLSSQNCIS
jgi:hypothetical protein